MTTIVTIIPEWVYYIFLFIKVLFMASFALLAGGLGIFAAADVWWHFNQCPHCGRTRSDNRNRY